MSRFELNRRTTLALVAAASFFLATGQAHAAKDEIFTGLLSGAAVGGFDAVAYFENGAPVKGSSEFTVEYKGATWYFANGKNLAAFKSSPDKYAPQYGGYCAWAVSQGYTAKGDPKYWKIVGGKLYLNHSADVQSDWQKDIPGHIKAANSNWPKVLN